MGWVFFTKPSTHHQATLRSQSDESTGIVQSLSPYDALISNNLSTIVAVRKLGVQFTSEHMDDEDVQSYPKSVEYLVSLGIPNPAKAD